VPIASDLDLAIHSDDLAETITFCKNHKDVKRFKSVKKSFMTTLELFFHDNGYLSIDFIHDFKRKSVRFMNVNELLYASTKNKNGVAVPAHHHDVEYALMFYTLNGATVPQKYIEFFDQAEKASKLKTLCYFFKKYELEFSSIRDLLTSFETSQTAFKKKLNTELKPSLFQQLIAKTRYVQDTIKDRVGRRGFILTFSGVDGVGKTTVIDLVKEQLQSKYRKEVVLMRHRPKMLPILSAFKYGSVSRAESNSSHLEPNEVTKKSVLGSYLRFAYYYLDYFLGQFYVQVRYVWGGKIVLYDRYYFDLINHPQRTNLMVNRRFAKWLYRPILKPSLNVFLSASPDEIVKRKQELDIAQISTLTKKYLNLFGEFSRDNTSARYVVHRNDNLSTTVTDILQDIQQIA
jgi:thymidylate kinase